MQDAIRRLLADMGENPDREGLRRTPTRVEKSLRFMTEGYQQDPRQVIGSALFEQEFDEMVLVRDIEVYSLCEHHLVPFFGKAHVAYIPAGRIVVVGRINRVASTRRSARPSCRARSRTCRHCWSDASTRPARRKASALARSSSPVVRASAVGAHRWAARA